MYFNRKINKLIGFLVLFLLSANFAYFYFDSSRFIERFKPKSNIGAQTYSLQNEKICWEDWDFINYERSRMGPGEHGEPWNVTDPEELKKNLESVAKEGFFVDANQKMSLTRSLPDHRPKICDDRKYFEHLPNVSVIITFHNEIRSTLLRTVHSVYNRSPKKLLQEIILINDASTFPYLYEQLHLDVKEMFRGDTVKIYENKERQGLIKARMTGAKKAKAEVIIFLDSHMEVFNSWLPPLLDPLVTHPNFATVPVADGMTHDTFKPVHTGYGYRGIFDWNFRYQWLPLRPEHRKVEGDPYELPAMTGGSYAIRRDHFFHLGGYDEGLLIWNGENYELGLKLWLCDGGMLECPCSRVTHLSKLHSAYRNTEKPMDFIGRNLKRVAEVWLDEYKEQLYKADPKRFEKIDAGDLTALFEKKKSLNCKPFQYYLDVVAPEMLERYPIEPIMFAGGTIKSNAIPRCFGLPTNDYTVTGLVDCTIIKGASFMLTLEKGIKYNDTSDQCLNAPTLKFTNCHHQAGGQYWKFDPTTRLISNPSSATCLTVTTNVNATLLLVPCNATKVEQKWTWSYENQTALMDWENFGVKIG